MWGFNRKPKFIYQFSGCAAFEEKEICDPYDLIKHIQEENYRFKNDYYEGDLLITKIRNNKKGHVYYAQRIHLPQGEDVDWLEELTNFFTKKPLAYEVEELMEPKATQKSTSETSSTRPDQSPYTLADFEADLGTSSEAVTQEEVPILPTEQSQKVTAEQDLVTLTKSEFEALKQAMARQQTLVEELRSEMAQWQQNTNENDRGPSLPPIIEAENEGEQRKEPIAEPIVDSLQTFSYEASNDQGVQTVLSSTKETFNQALTDFITHETEKIQAEIQQLDQRDQIENTVAQRIDKEQKEQLTQLKQRLSATKEQELQAEQSRHEERIQAIEQTYQTQLAEQSTTLQDNFNQQKETAIKEEYEEQTKQLARILQGKMDELQLRQNAMNVGLEANFKAALANFNREHRQVIEEVERKKQCAPIDLVERRRLKQA
ncbi:hypothetical protein [Enterococcus sp. DIV1420a]|uniref:hypothetical protein n=1 Tax=Enterococcus TaxID=1350 RepID=UPI003F23CCD3